MLFVLRYGIIIKPSSVGRFYYNVLYCSIGLFCFASRQASVMEGEDACAGVAGWALPAPASVFTAVSLFPVVSVVSAPVSARPCRVPDRRGGVRRVNGCGL